jgi:hypothetical protein
VKTAEILAHIKKLEARVHAFAPYPTPLANPYGKGRALYCTECGQRREFIAHSDRLIKFREVIGLIPPEGRVHE